MLAMNCAHDTQWDGFVVSTMKTKTKTGTHSAMLQDNVLYTTISFECPLPWPLQCQRQSLQRRKAMAHVGYNMMHFDWRRRALTF